MKKSLQPDALGPQDVGHAIDLRNINRRESLIQLI